MKGELCVVENAVFKIKEEETRHSPYEVLRRNLVVVPSDHVALF
jgi:hypothetical protein